MFPPPHPHPFSVDAKPADKVVILVHGPCKESCLQNVGLESHSLAFYKRDFAAEVSDMSSTSVPAIEFIPNQNSPLLDVMTVKNCVRPLRVCLDTKL